MSSIIEYIELQHWLDGHINMPNVDITLCSTDYQELQGNQRLRQTSRARRERRLTTTPTNTPLTNLTTSLATS